MFFTPLFEEIQNFLLNTNNQFWYVSHYWVWIILDRSDNTYHGWSKYHRAECVVRFSQIFRNNNLAFYVFLPRARSPALYVSLWRSNKALAAALGSARVRKLCMTNRTCVWIVYDLIICVERVSPSSPAWICTTLGGQPRAKTLGSMLELLHVAGYCSSGHILQSDWVDLSTQSN